MSKRNERLDAIMEAYEDDARDERLGLRLSARELAMAKQLARISGLSASDVIRLALRQAYYQATTGVVPSMLGGVPATPGRSGAPTMSYGLDVVPTTKPKRKKGTK